MLVSWQNRVRLINKYELYEDFSRQSLQNQNVKYDRVTLIDYTDSRLISLRLWEGQRSSMSKYVSQSFIKRERIKWLYCRALSRKFSALRVIINSKSKSSKSAFSLACRLILYGLWRKARDHVTNDKQILKTNYSRSYNTLGCVENTERPLFAFSIGK